MSMSCGRQCNRRLTCTNHFCELECHAVTDAIDNASVSYHDADATFYHISLLMF